jgi:hypothetical protein
MKNLSLLLLAQFLFLASAKPVMASDKDHVFRNEPTKHTFDLASFDGQYKLIETQYSKLWKDDNSGKTPCPGEPGENVIIKSNSIKEPRGNNMYYNDSVAFWTAGNPSESVLITSIEYIDKGDNILSYSNGPSNPIKIWAACKFIPLSGDCKKGYDESNKYYAQESIDSVDTFTKSKTLSISTAKLNSVVHGFQSKHSISYTNGQPTQIKEQHAYEALVISKNQVSYITSWQDKIVRSCKYEKQ